MPPIQSLFTAQIPSTPSAEFADLSRNELQSRLQRLMRRIALHDATERVASIGHYEWSRERDQLIACPEEYANLFNMSVEEILASHKFVSQGNVSRQR